MVTINQLVRHPRKAKVRKAKGLALKYNWNSLRKRITPLKKPQISGIVKEGGVKVLSPAKPNSACRACARVVLSNKKNVTVYIPGEKHNVQSYSSVLIQGGGAKDVPGIKYSIVRGYGDVQGVEGRKQGRSLYGTKTPT